MVQNSQSKTQTEICFNGIKIFLLLFPGIMKQVQDDGE